jgi:hypothetical protein
MPVLRRCQQLISFSLNESTEEARVGRFWQGRNRGVLENIRNPEILDDIELLTTKVYLHKYESY